MRILKCGFALLIFAMIVSGCRNEQKNSETNAQAEKPVETMVNNKVPEFNADSAYFFVAKQVAFGPRIPGTPAQQHCAQWLQSKLQSYGAKVVVQDVMVEVYTGKQVPCKNIIGSFNPEVPKRILLCSHWDTRPWSDRDKTDNKKAFDGADDGGSGVGILLEIARLLSNQKTAVGIDIAFFDVEDYGPPDWEDRRVKEKPEQYCIGTQHWADGPHVPDYRAYYGILLDMVGAKDAQFLQEGLSMQYAPSVVRKIWETARSLGYGNYFIESKAASITDDHAFINSINGTPCIDIINLDKNSETGFAKHWHTQQDNMSIIDKNTLKAVGQTLLQVIYNEAPST